MDHHCPLIFLLVWAVYEKYNVINNNNYVGNVQIIFYLIVLHVYYNSKFMRYLHSDALWFR